ncbi:MAG TPA: sigma-70 family RNA polymerase sigma factor [Acidisarcina sp.]
MFNFGERSSTETSTAVICLRAAKQSAEEYRRDIFDSHRHRVFALAYYMTGSEIEAEQILTETFVQAFESTETPAAPEIDSALVGELRSRFPLEEAPAAVPSGSHDLSNRNVRRTDLEEAIQYLPATERLCFLMRDVEGYSVEAIAKVVELPEATVQRTLFSARIRLRAALSREQNTEAAA